MVKSGSSYLSQSELPVTFGLGKRKEVDRLLISWPSGRVQEHRSVAAGSYVCEEAGQLTLERR